MGTGLTARGFNTGREDAEALAEAGFAQPKISVVMTRQNVDQLDEFKASADKFEILFDLDEHGTCQIEQCEDVEVGGQAKMIRDARGSLRLVDWDTALVAPRERDPRTNDGLHSPTLPSTSDKSNNGCTTPSPAAASRSTQVPDGKTTRTSVRPSSVTSRRSFERRAESAESTLRRGSAMRSPARQSSNLLQISMPT